MVKHGAIHVLGDGGVPAEEGAERGTLRRLDQP